MLKSLLTATALASMATAAHAADTYEIDASHTNIVWSASHLGFSKSFGTFSDVKGHFTLDEANPDQSTVEITVMPASVVTGIPKFNEHLKSDDFFDVDTYPEAMFKSRKVIKTGDKTADIHGELTMLGQTHPLVLNATLNKIGENPHNSKQTAGFSLSGSIDRTQYGMNYAVPGVPAEVDLMIEAEGVLKSE